ncbi:MAG: hypothetical protein IJC76_02520 [Lachnospiraceae bacterium]|nr:hypothetical protein [Lachnospiraceae bacterium]
MDNNFNEEPNYTGEVVGEPKESGKAKASMICGIIGVVLCVIGCFCCIGYAGVPLAIIAIVMAMMSKNETDGELTQQAKIGLICGIAALLVLVLGFVIGFVIGFASAFTGA